MLCSSSCRTCSIGNTYSPLFSLSVVTDLQICNEWSCLGCNVGRQSSRGPQPSLAFPAGRRCVPNAALTGVAAVQGRYRHVLAEPHLVCLCPTEHEGLHTPAQALCLLLVPGTLMLRPGLHGPSLQSTHIPGKASQCVLDSPFNTAVASSLVVPRMLWGVVPDARSTHV